MSFIDSVWMAVIDFLPNMAMEGARDIFPYFCALEYLDFSDWMLGRESASIVFKFQAILCIIMDLKQWRTYIHPVD